jgi:hypothetical protein
MSNYKGDLKGFPPEVVEWMLDQQEAQGNKRDVSVFEKDRFVDNNSGGFTWYDTKEEGIFCTKVIRDRNFTLFFEKHPKKTPEPEPAQTPDFDEHRFQAACAAMAALLSSHSMSFDLPSELAARAAAHADALLSALKGGDK